MSPEEAAVLKHVAMSKAEVIRETTAGLKVGIPDAPDIAEGVLAGGDAKLNGGVLGVQLKRDGVPVVGSHWVLWGSELLGDVRPRPVLRSLSFSEDTHVAAELAVTALGVFASSEPDASSDTKTLSKEPPSKERLAAAERYARWRYKGYLCKEISGL